MGSNIFNDDEVNNLRKCRICEIWKPRNNIHFVSNKQCKYGITGRCKKCRNTHSKMWKKENRDSLLGKRRSGYKKESKIEKKRIIKRWKENPIKMRAKVMIAGIGSRSKIKNIEWDKNLVNYDFIFSSLEKSPECECCKRSFSFIPKGGKPQDSSPSIDRVNKNLGYTIDNISILCWRCNNLKRDASSKELQKIVDWMKGKGV